ncbi:hypothetical protein [Methylobacterium sp. CM6257]
MNGRAVHRLRAAQSCEDACSRVWLRVEGIMTDAGGLDVTDAGSRVEERERLLGQIAEALAVPVSTFRRGRSAAQVCGPTASECAALLAAFSRIDDPNVRKECLAMVERYGNA